MLNATKLASSKESPDQSQVVYKLRDMQGSMVKAWEDSFSEHPAVEISHGDIFKEAPVADAIVSPANSFGFMDGGIDMYYSHHFGWQMQDRLQVAIKQERNGELLVGDALIIPSYSSDEEREKMETMRPHASIINEGKPITYLISAPTMRVPQDVRQTVNAYLAFRAVILAVKRHNADSSREPIRSVLCPGLGTAVGRMSKTQCAKQMLLAYETFELGLHGQRIQPQTLHDVYLDQANMIEVPDYPDD